MTIFMMQGLIIGVIGTVCGGALGLGLCHVLDRYRLIRIPSDVYQVSYVPFTIQPLDFTVVIVAAIVICFVATLYPSRQAAKLDPANHRNTATFSQAGVQCRTRRPHSWWRR